MAEVVKRSHDAYRSAIEKQETLQADHMIYGHYDLADSREIEIIWLYSGIPYTDAEPGG